MQCNESDAAQKQTIAKNATQRKAQRKQQTMPSDSTKHWYAFRIYHNSRKRFLETLDADFQEYYLVRQYHHSLELNYNEVTTSTLLFPSIVFVKTTPLYVEAVRRNPDSEVSVYTYPGTKAPAIISDKEMETFMFVLNTGCEQLDVVDEKKLAKGTKVRVTDGVFKGAEGFIVRIKGDHRFVVSISGIAAVATSYIPQKFLEKIQ